MQTRTRLLRQPLLLWALCALPLDAALAHESTEAACRALVEAYAYHRDRLDADAAASLFTEHARLDIMGEQFKGREAIRQRLLAARGGPLTRHMLSTVHIQQTGPQQARGVSYVTIYQAPPAAQRPQAQARAQAEVRIIGEYHDGFELTADGWKIADRRFEPVMTP